MNKVRHPVLSWLNIGLGTVIIFAFLFFIPLKVVWLSLLFILIGISALSGGILLLLNKKEAIPCIKTVSWFAIGFGTLLSLLCVTSAVYLAGIYGRLGKTASGLFLFLIFVFILLFILLPAIQLFYINKEVA